MEITDLIESILGQNGLPGSALHVTLVKNTGSISFSRVASVLSLLSTLQRIHPLICAPWKSQVSIWHIKDLTNKS